MTVVLADGKVVRCGGRVIKNVAGYDLAKLFCGALGTLGLVAEAVLRLHPLPEHRLSVRFDGPRQSLHQLLAEILRSPLVPSALDYAQGSLWCRFEGSCQGTRAQAARSESQAGELGIRVTRIEGKEEEEEWVRVAEKTAGANAASEVSVVRAVTLPDALRVAETALETAAEERGVQAEMASHAGIGLHTARLAGGGPADHGAVISAWRDALSRMGGTVSIRRPMPGLDPAGLTGPPPPSLPLMKAVKLALDPEGRLEPGRFSPWW
jgi:glycolate oxidase FAD binding subunit